MRHGKQYPRYARTACADKRYEHSGKGFTRSSDCAGKQIAEQVANIKGSYKMQYAYCDGNYIVVGCAYK